MLEYSGQFNNAVFRALARGAAGSTLRVGGISADFTTFQANGTDAAAALHQVMHPSLGDWWPNYTRPLTPDTFLGLLEFVQQASMHLVYDLNELTGRDCFVMNSNCTFMYTCPNWCEGSWNTSNVRGFLQWVHDEGLYSPPAPDGTGGSTLLGFELGNELFSHLAAQDNVQDIHALAAMVQDIWSDVPTSARPPIFAPATDVCDPTTLSIMQNITGVANVFSYHAYPGGDGQGDHALTNILLNSTWLRTGIMTGSGAGACIEYWNSGPRQAGMELWVTEAAASYNNVPPPGQNSFIHGFFSIAELGQYALAGVGMIGRWIFAGDNNSFNFIGLNATRGDGLWDVAADYFLYYLYNQTRSVGTGSGVFQVTGAEASAALVYAHCASGSASGAPTGAVTVMAINPSNGTLTLAVNDVGTGSAVQTLPRLEYVLTPPGGDLASYTPSLNGGPPLRVGEDGSLPSMEPLVVQTGQAELTLPPTSQAFFVLLNAAAAVCK